MLPNTSLAITTLNTTPTAAIHKGMEGGSDRVKSIEVTKYPSLISCPRLEANHSSNRMPVTNTVMYSGIK